ncbi:MAG: ATP-binding protein [Gemmatimonadota bacterium]
MVLSNSEYTRPQLEILLTRLREPKRFIQVISGARQVGKTTLALQAAERLEMPHVFASADQPALRGVDWIEQQWTTARLRARDSERGALLVLDEVQKISDWSESVKRLWDEDVREDVPLHVVLLGSAPLLIRDGLTESLAGRFELLRLPHWNFREMREAFGLSLADYLYFGGYPGSAPLMDDVDRWSAYIRDSLIETTISRDVLLLTRIDKPALLRRLFDLGCRYSGQILSYNKMLGQLHDAGNTTTLAHYLDLLAGAGLLVGLQKYSGSVPRQRASSPKLQVLNNALFTVMSGVRPEDVARDPAFRGRLVESAVGAHLANAAEAGEFDLHYWRERGQEVDFVVTRRDALTAIEVKSGRSRDARSGLSSFADRYETERKLLIGGDGVGVEEFLSRDPGDFLA